MKIKKFNELYEQNPKEKWGSDIDENNYYTFTCDITVRAKNQEEAEDKMEFIANQNQDVELGTYNLSASTVDGKGTLHGVKEPSEEIDMNMATPDMLEKLNTKTKK